MRARHRIQNVVIAVALRGRIPRGRYRLCGADMPLVGVWICDNA